ncbi:LysR substrate-binding domain-containing protein [Humitalea sp. 24SJ18S-53]|uniref:LysR substrate-binding domain-containing protein n=1 Tax=Humitalea sp. 24SJ18S-53 TaxID=3422307 RepID=UPI003D6659E5
MELRHLRYFVALAEELHFGRAAARLGMAQPPLSVQIRALESEIGTLLVERHPRGVRLTAAGAAFLAKAREVLEGAAEAAVSARDAAAGRGGRLVLGYMHSLALGALPRLLPVFRAACPGADLALRELDASTNEAAVIEGIVTAGLCRPPVRHRDVTTEVLAPERLILAMPEDHPLARHGRVHVAALADQVLLGMPRDSAETGLAATIADFLERHAVRPRSRQSFRTVQTALGLVLAGEGVAILPETAALMAVRGIAFRRFAEDELWTETALCWRSDTRNPLIGPLLEAARQTLGEAPTAPE